MSNSMVVGAFYIVFFIQSNSSRVKVSFGNKCRRAPTRGSGAFVSEQR
jgi:hypothetical protein